MERFPFFVGEVDASFPRVNLSPEKDVLKVAITDSPDAGFTDYKVFDASGILLFELSEKRLKVLEGKLVT